MLAFPALAEQTVSSVILPLPCGPAPLGDLPATDQVAARAVQHIPSRTTFVWGRLFLRMWLEQSLQLPANDVPITVQNGRPFVANDPVHFNLSHSADHLMIAMARDHPVGVDIEPATTVTDPLPVSRMVMSARETALLRRLPEHARRRAFVRLWVRREAYLKYRHTGFAGNDPTRPCLGRTIDVARLDGQTGPHHWCITTHPATRIDPPLHLSHS